MQCSGAGENKYWGYMDTWGWKWPLNKNGTLMLYM